MYFVYKITNKITNDYYIGVHRMIEKEDNYFGSGLRLKRSIKKYGIENFIEEPLFIFDNPDEAFSKEKEILKVYLKDKRCLNLAEGGRGGATFTGHHHSEIAKDKMRLKAIGRKHTTESNHKKGDWCRGKTYSEIYGEREIGEKNKRSLAHIGKIFTEEHRKNLGIARTKIVGWHHSIETKEKIGAATRGEKHWNWKGNKSLIKQQIACV